MGLSGELQRQATAAASAIAAGAGLRGVCGLDFVLSAGKLWLLEVNPRIPASHWIYDSRRSGLSLRLQLGGDLAEPATTVQGGFRLQLIVWHPEQGEAAGDMPARDCLPDGVRLADLPDVTDAEPGSPAFSVLLESCSADGALQVLRRAGLSSGAGAEFWRQASVDFEAVLRSFRRHL